MITTKEKIIQGFSTEIAYQKQMLENLGRWFSLLFIISGIGLVLVIPANQVNMMLKITGIVLLTSSSLGMLLIGYGIYKGKQNLHKVVNHFEQKLKTVK